MLLPRGNPAAVRNAGQGVPNRACATDWPSRDNRTARRARVNADSCETTSVARVADWLAACMRRVREAELRRFDIFFDFCEKFVKYCFT